MQYPMQTSFVGLSYTQNRERGSTRTMVMPTSSTLMAVGGFTRLTARRSILKEDSHEGVRSTRPDERAALTIASLSSLENFAE